MKYIKIIILTLCFTTFFVNAQSPQLLLNDSGLASWKVVGDAHWQFENGELFSNSGGLGYLMTKQSYKNFRLTLEFFPVAEVNSGVFIRISDTENIAASTAYEMNIWDEHPNQDFRTGSIVTRVAPPLAHVETLNQWNAYEIVAKDNHITARVNGILTAELIDDSLAIGPIALQRGDTGAIRFRNVRLTLLP